MGRSRGQGLSAAIMLFIALVHPTARAAAEPQKPTPSSAPSSPTTATVAKATAPDAAEVAAQMPAIASLSTKLVALQARIPDVQDRVARTQTDAGPADGAVADAESRTLDLTTQLDAAIGRLRSAAIFSYVRGASIPKWVLET